MAASCGLLALQRKRPGTEAGSRPFRAEPELVRTGSRPIALRTPGSGRHPLSATANETTAWYTKTPCAASTENKGFSAPIPACIGNLQRFLSITAKAWSEFIQVNFE